MRPSSEQRRLDALQPIRQAVMGSEVSGHFGVRFGPGGSGLIEAVTVSLKGGPSLVIEDRGGYLDVSLKA